MDQLNELLARSEVLRSGYRSSLGTGVADLRNRLPIESIPDDVVTLYSEVSGTIHQVQNQKFMDFIPGYRLIHVDEMSDALNQVSQKAPGVFPVLADYSGNYFGVRITDNVFVSVHSDDPEPMLVSRDLPQFLRTVSALYDADVYSLDEHGFLQSDFEKEGKIAGVLNPDAPYWYE